MSTEIPEDVMKAAREAAAQAWEALNNSDSMFAEPTRRGERDESLEVQTAVRAILAERRRWQRDEEQAPYIPVYPASER